jgi:2-(1,2-epoxy-1,2-dihydrophenyl)acetyl-CoA isomerase
VPATEPVVTVENADHVRILRLNRPEKKNALSEELGWAVGAAIEEAAADDDVWVVGITGAGDAFCSGLDLTPAASGRPPASPLTAQDAALDDLGWIGRIPVLLRERCDKPVVAGVNGVAVGAGLSLAMAADIRLASSSARFLAGYARMATSPDGGLSFTLTQALGYERAMRFLLEGRMHSAQEALALGLVGEVVDDARFAERFREYCASLAAISPVAARQTKRVVHRALLAGRLAEHAAYELVNARRGLRTEDGEEARAAFLERRPPAYRGR